MATEYVLSNKIHGTKKAVVLFYEEENEVAFEY